MWTSLTLQLTCFQLSLIVQHQSVHARPPSMWLLSRCTGIFSPNVLAASVKEFILKLCCCVMVSGGKNLTRIKKINSFSPTKTTSVLTPAFPGDFGHFDKQLLQFLLNWWGFPSPDNFITAGAHYEAVNYSEKSWYHLSNWHPSTPLLL